MTPERIKELRILWKNPVVAWREINECLDGVEALQTRSESLARYATHSRQCQEDHAWSDGGKDWKCSCGLSALLAGKEAQK